jgi:hypothetical protein
VSELLDAGDDAVDLDRLAEIHEVDVEVLRTAVDGMVAVAS